MARKSRKNVGLIGLGIIGSRVAASLRSAGFHVFVWSRSPRPEPNFLGSAAEIAEICDTIQLFVPDAQSLFETMEGLGDVLSARHTIICCATVGPEATVQAAKLAQEKGASFLDAPFTGSKLAAERRELVYFIGGDGRVLERVEPVLKASSKAILRVGEIGHAATIKVATNMMTAVAVQTLAEALAVVQRSGIDPDVFATALEHHAVRSPVLDMKLPKMVHGEFDPHFSLKHMFKDVQLAIHIANSLDLDIPATTATAGVMYGGLNHGWADLDFSVLSKVYDPEKQSLPALAAAGPQQQSLASPAPLVAVPEVSDEFTAIPSNTDQEPAKPPALHLSPGLSLPEVEGERPVVPPKETLAHMAPPPRPEALEPVLPALHVRPVLADEKPKTSAVKGDKQGKANADDREEVRATLAGNSQDLGVVEKEASETPRANGINASAPASTPDQASQPGSSDSSEGQNASSQTPASGSNETTGAVTIEPSESKKPAMNRIRRFFATKP